MFRKGSTVPRGRKLRSAGVEGGVTITPVPVTQGEVITIQYQGSLAGSGAEQIFLHTGYGPAGDWQQVADLPMKHNGQAWEASFKVTDASRLNFCFKDNAGNWDNNHGRNWSLEVHTGDLY